MFEAIADPFERRAIAIAYGCMMSEPELVEWFKTYLPPKGSYMLDTHPNTQKMSALLEAEGEHHSGASFGLVMHAMRRIAQHGLDGFLAAYPP